jgi:hypothetical protein
VCDLAHEEQQQAEAKLEAAQKEMEASTAGAQLEAARRALQDLGHKLDALRGERDRAAAANDTNTRLQ